MGDGPHLSGGLLYAESIQLLLSKWCLSICGENTMEWLSGSFTPMLWADMVTRSCCFAPVGGEVYEFIFNAYDPCGET